MIGCFCAAYLLLMKSVLNQALYFHHQDCGICVALAPKLKAMMEEQYPKLDLVWVDIEQEKEKAAEYRVFTSPTFIIILEDKEFYRFVRNFALFEVQEKLDRLYPLLFK